MKKRKKLQKVLVLLLVVIFMIVGCGKAEGGKAEGGRSILVSDTGLATWEATEGAVAYEVTFVYGDYIAYLVQKIEGTSVQVPEGFMVQVQPIYADGSFGDYYTDSEYYGTPITQEQIWELESQELLAGGHYLGPVQPSEESGGEDIIVTSKFTIDFDTLQNWDLIASIDTESVVEQDGTVTFSATAPSGETIRFFGEDVEVSPGAIKIGKNGRLYSLDAIGSIYGMKTAFSDGGDENNTFIFSGGYCFTGENSVSDVEPLLFSPSRGNFIREIGDREFTTYELAHYQPNYVVCGAYPPDYSFGASTNVDDMVLSKLELFYDESIKHTPIRYIGIPGTAISYVEGDVYNKAGEMVVNGMAELLVNAYPDIANEKETPSKKDTLFNFGIAAYIKPLFSVGDLKDAQGNVLDKDHAILTAGTSLEVTIGKYTMNVELPICRQLAAGDSHEAAPSVYPQAKGELNLVVIPIAWQDQPDRASDEIVSEFRNYFGRVMDDAGMVTDYSEALAEDRFALSEYFDISSYGNLKVQSFFTNWYQAPYDFSVMKDAKLDGNFFVEVTDWLYATYPDMNWAKFDKDGNGYLDAVIFVNAGDEPDASYGYMMESFGGAYMQARGNTGVYAGTQEKPEINAYMTVHYDLLDGNAVIHEFGHMLGIADYYDTTYSGINAVGSYDMQADSVGDWNAFSKYSVGWLSPTVVTGLEKGQSVDVEIGTMTTAGDAILIPGADSAYNNTPFAEYMLVDLFAQESLHEYDAKDYDLDGAVGVRIYHVDATMFGHETMYNSGDEHVWETYGFFKHTNDLDENGFYQLELIQSGGDNTFTAKDKYGNDVSRDDLFYSGDTFEVEKYKEFFKNGKMDDGTDFGYEIKVVSIEENADGGPKAVIRITRK